VVRRGEELYLSIHVDASTIAPSLWSDVPHRPSLRWRPYARVKQHLRDALATGRWPPGTLMPSEAELVAQFGVSRMTVNRALRELQTEGLVERTQGVGTFAAQLGRVASQLTIRDLHEEISERGHQHRSVVHRRAPSAPARRWLRSWGWPPGPGCSTR
jgi:GntR family histidine utilization transcriptional repressor